MSRRLVFLTCVLGLMLAALIVAGPLGAANGQQADCTVRLKQGAESHAILFRTTCNFQQSEVRLDPDSRIAGFDHHPTVRGQADPEDGMRCTRDDHGGHLLCRGSAGKGARVRGMFDTPSLSCDVATDVEITGGLDCDGEVCPALAFVVIRKAVRPAGCA